MGMAIIAIFIVTAQKGFPSAVPQEIAMGLIVLISLIISAQFLKKIEIKKQG